VSDAHLYGPGDYAPPQEESWYQCGACKRLTRAKEIDEGTCPKCGGEDLERVE
jgi:rRNA maturation endonuclease Nob1